MWEDFVRITKVAGGWVREMSGDFGYRAYLYPTRAAARRGDISDAEGSEMIDGETAKNRDLVDRALGED